MTSERTSASISFLAGEAGINPYQSARSTGYDAVSGTFGGGRETARVLDASPPGTISPRRRGDRMKRREFLALAAGAFALPEVTRARSATVPLVGYLSSNAKGTDAKLIGELQRGLSEQGFIEGKTVEIEFHWSEGGYERLSSQAAQLVARKVDVIVASGLPATLAAKAATSTIPIVFRFAVDPVAYQVVRSFDHPGGNLTGVTMLFDPLTPKKLQLLLELAKGSSFGFLVNPKNPNVGSHQEQAETAARALRLQLTVLTASSAAEIEQAFALAHEKAIAAILLGDDPFFRSNSEQLVEAAARYRVPTMYYVRDFPDVGGLISYGPNFDEMAHQTVQYVGRILKGAKPADLPVQQPTKFELVVNLKTAKALGITVPPILLERADEVIE
jgi:putative tryptophan/tyrosine transport system substrate-binding protein